MIYELKFDSKGNLIAEYYKEGDAKITKTFDLPKYNSNKVEVDLKKWFITSKTVNDKVAKKKVSKVDGPEYATTLEIVNAKRAVIGR